MSTLESLPIEIITSTIGILCREDMANCLLVNKLFYKCCIQEFYSSMVLTLDHVDDLQYYLKSKKPNQDANFCNNNNLIKKMRLHPCPNYLQRFFECLEIFPSLTCIDISINFDIHIILKLLLDCKETILPNLQKLIVLSEDDSMLKSDYLFKNFYQCVCYKYRRTLTHIEIFDPYSTYSLQYTDYNETHINLLPHFKKLESLTVYYQCHDQQIHRLLSHTILHACPNLIQYKIFCDYDLYEVFDSPSFSPKIQNIKCLNNNSIPGLSKLKSVYLQILTMNTLCMESIISDIPIAQLDKFTLELFCGDQMNQWIKSTDMNTLKNFLQHLKSAKKSTIFAQHRDELSNLQLLQEGLYSIRKLWTVSNTLKSEKISKIYLQVQFQNGRKDQDLSFNLDLKNRIFRGYQGISERFFFSDTYSYLSLAPFYDTVFREEIEEIEFNVNRLKAHEGIQALLKRFSHVKKLIVNYEENQFIMYKKPMIQIPNHLQVKKNHPIKNHYSPVNIETDYKFINEKCLIYGSKYDHLVVDSYKISRIPLNQDKIILTPNIEFKHLVLDFDFYSTFKLTMLVLVQFLNSRTGIGYNFMAFVGIENQTVTHVPGLYCLEDCSKNLRGGIIQILSQEFEEISILNLDQIVYNEVLTKEEKLKSPQVLNYK